MKKRFRYFLYVCVFCFLFLCYSYLESRWVKIKRIDVVSAEIPASFHEKTIVFVTDIHHGPYLSEHRVRKMVERVNALNPDFILMGGDYVQRDPKYIHPALDAFRKFEPGYDVYAVLGNHDHWEDEMLSRELMLRNGFKICDNRSYWAVVNNDSIKIGGVGDMWEDIQLLDSTTHDVKNEDFCVLISHNPDYLEYMESDKVDLTLSGHTHGGQMTLFGLWAPVLPSIFGQKYRYGMIYEKNRLSYISSGVGTVTPPVRFFCRPEIVLITLKKEAGN